MRWRYFCEDRVSDSFGLAADEAMALRVGEKLLLQSYAFIHIVLTAPLLDVSSE